MTFRVKVHTRLLYDGVGRIGRYYGCQNMHIVQWDEWRYRKYRYHTVSAQYTHCRSYTTRSEHASLEMAKIDENDERVKANDDAKDIVG